MQATRVNSPLERTHLSHRFLLDVVTPTEGSSENDSELLRNSNYSGFRIESTWHPIVMVKGEGVFLEDAQGKKYLDMSSQPAAVNLGHNNRRVIEAIKNQADKLAYVGVGFGTDIRAEFSRKLKKLIELSLYGWKSETGTKQQN